MDDYAKEMKNYIGGLEAGVEMTMLEITSLTIQEDVVGRQLAINRERVSEMKETLKLAKHRLKEYLIK